MSNLHGAKVDHFGIVNTICASYFSMQPCMFWGGPGLGKSGAVRTAAETLQTLVCEEGEEFHLVDLRLLLLEPSDLRGLPYVDSEDNCQWAIAPFLPTDSNAKGILFLDELPAASQQLMKASYQLVLDRKVGEYTLPDGFLVVAAGNRISDRGGVNVMPTPLKNRFLHLELDETTIFPSWKEWGYQNQVHDAVMGFVCWKPTALYAFTTEYNAFPTPRTWEMVSNMLYAFEDFTPIEGLQKSKSPEEFKQKLLKAGIEGLIGPGTSAEFHAFMRVREKIPNKEVILKNSEYNLEFNKADVVYAVNSMLVSHFVQKYQDKKAPTMTEVMGSLNFIKKITAKEMQAACLRDLAVQGRLNTVLHHPKTDTDVKKMALSLFDGLKQYM